MSDKAPRVLVVDDDAQFCAFVLRLLARAGFEGEAAAGTRAAAARLREASFDAVLLDVVMQDEDGWSFLRRLPDLTNAPAILMTGAMVDQDTRKDALLLGARAALQKPFSGQELLGALNAALGA